MTIIPTMDIQDNIQEKAIKRRKPRAKIPTPTQAKIISVGTNHPDLSSTEIAKICDTSHVHVLNTFNRYGIDRQSTEDYKHNRADIFAGVQHRVLQSITDEDIKASTLSARSTIIGTLYDKERLERGLSTANVALATMSEADIDAELAAIRARLDNIIDITPEPNTNTPKANTLSLSDTLNEAKHGHETEGNGV